MPRAAALGVVVLSRIVDQDPRGLTAGILEHDVVIERPRKIHRPEEEEGQQRRYQGKLDERLGVLPARALL
jgi:hypothetical protein